MRSRPAAASSRSAPLGIASFHPSGALGFRNLHLQAPGQLGPPLEHRLGGEGTAPEIALSHWRSPKWTTQAVNAWRSPRCWPSRPSSRTKHLHQPSWTQIEDVAFAIFRRQRFVFEPNGIGPSSRAQRFLCRASFRRPPPCPSNPSPAPPIIMRSAACCLATLRRSRWRMPSPLTRTRLRRATLPRPGACHVDLSRLPEAGL